jgi:hypothetical protein
MQNQVVPVTALVSHAVVEWFPNATKGAIATPNAAWGGFAIDLLNSIVANLK